ILRQIQGESVGSLFREVRMIVTEPECGINHFGPIHQQAGRQSQAVNAHECSEDLTQGLQQYVLARFQIKTGSVVEFVKYHEHLFELLVAMYEAFEPKRGAQGLPPLGRDRIVAWLRPLLSESLNLLALYGGKVIGHTMLCPIPLKK